MSPAHGMPFPFGPLHVWPVGCWPACVWSVHCRVTLGSFIGLFVCFAIAPSSSLLPCVSSASFFSLPLCISSALSFALLPVLTPSLQDLGLGHLFPSPLAATSPWPLQPRGCGALLVDPPRAILPGAAGHISPARGVVAAPSSSAPDERVRVSARHVSLDNRVLGAVAPAA